jgi:hypothetical protein
MTTPSTLLEPKLPLRLFYHGSDNYNFREAQPATCCDTLDDLCSALRHNRTHELRLGYNKSAHFVLGKQSAHMIERALRHNTSVTHVSIGLKNLDKRSHRRAVYKILFAVAKYLQRQVTHLQIVLNDYLSEHVLKTVLCHLTSLVSLELHGVHVLGGSSCCCSSETWRDSLVCDHNVVSRVIVTSTKSTRLKSLYLHDCSITDHVAMMLSDFLHARGGISRLSLRGNRQLGSKGLEVICQAPVMDRLDLSLCDLEVRDALAISESIAKRPWLLKELLLCGNYRMDTAGLVSLTVQACCDKIKSLSISHCDVTDYKACKIIENLQKLTDNSVLQKLTMQGSNIGTPEVSEALCQLFALNTSLRVVKLDNPAAPKNFGPPELEDMLKGLETNYELEEFHYDSLRSFEETKIRMRIEFLMKLNRAGRRFLRRKQPVLKPQTHKNTNEREEWLSVLEKAGQDMDVLYWIVKESADRFDTLVKGLKPTGRA